MAMVEVKSDITGMVWKILVKEGTKVAEDDVLMILESMKMEIPVVAPQDAVVKEIRVREGDHAAEGEVVALLQI